MLLNILKTTALSTLRYQMRVLVYQYERQAIDYEMTRKDWGWKARFGLKEMVREMVGKVV